MKSRIDMARYRLLGRAGGVLLCGLVLVGGSMVGGAARATLARETSPTDAKVVFAPVDDSGVVGAASLTAKGERTVVEIRLDGAMGDHPTHIHQGTCDDLDPNPEFPLTNVQLMSAGLTGMSATTIDVPLQELLETDHLILIHRSAKDIGSYIACGNIVAGKLSAKEAAAAGGSAPLPNTGAGAQVPDRSAIRWYLLIAAGLISAAVGSLLRRR